MTVGLDGHDNSVLNFRLRLVIIPIARVGVSLGIGCEVIVVENAFLGRRNLIIDLVAKKVIAALVEGVNWVF